MIPKIEFANELAKLKPEEQTALRSLHEKLQGKEQDALGIAIATGKKDATAEALRTLRKRTDLSRLHSDIAKAQSGFGDFLDHAYTKANALAAETGKKIIVAPISTAVGTSVGVSTMSPNLGLAAKEVSGKVMNSLLGDPAVYKELPRYMKLPIVGATLGVGAMLIAIPMRWFKKTKEKGETLHSIGKTALYGSAMYGIGRCIYEGMKTPDTDKDKKKDNPTPPKNPDDKKNNLPKGFLRGIFGTNPLGSVGIAVFDGFDAFQKWRAQQKTPEAQPRK